MDLSPVEWWFGYFWPSIKGNGPVINLMEDVFDEINLDEYYRYMGSLTTPPCTQGLYWHVLKEPLDIGAEQLVARACTGPRALVPSPGALPCPCTE